MMRPMPISTFMVFNPEIVSWSVFLEEDSYLFSGRGAQNFFKDSG